MVTLTITRGVPGSGKSTWAKQWVAESPQWRIRVNRDDLRVMGYDKYVLDRMCEDSITVAQQSQVLALLKAHINVVVDDTNLRAQTVRQWQKIALEAGAEVEFKDFNIDLDTALARNAKRAQEGGHDVPEAVIRSFFERYVHKGALPAVPEMLVNPERVWVPYSPKDGTSQAILVDIDGTLARMGDRSPYDWERVGEDTLIHHVAEVVKSLHALGRVVVFMSGRDEACRSITTSWLLSHGFTVDHLYMRHRGDMRPDDIVKHELFNDHVRDYFDVVGVFDDRLKVCQMWENIGLTLFRVGPLNSDF